MSSVESIQRDAKWTGGSSQSIYATSAALSSPQIDATKLTGRSPSRSHKPDQGPDSPGVDQGEWIGAHSHKKPARSRISVKVGHRNAEKASLDSIGVDAGGPSLSLSERLGMPADAAGDSSATSSKEPLLQREFDHGSTGYREPLHASLHSTSTQSPIAKTPLSASHPLPDTPLKHEGRKGRLRDDVTPASSGSDLRSHNSNLRIGSIPKGGLMLDAGGGDPVLPRELQTPGKEHTRTSVSRKEDEVPLPQKSTASVDQMIAKLHLTQSPAAGSQESRWAIKPSQEAGANTAKAAGLPTDNDDVFASSAQKRQPDVSSTTPSLLDRMSPATSTQREPHPEGKARKERKRGSRKREERKEETVVNAAVTASDESKLPAPTVDAVIAPSASSDKPSQDSVLAQELKEENKPVSASTSTASLVASSSSQSFHAANDTLTSINWADDDDELPDLPEEWTRAAQSCVLDADLDSSPVHDVSTSPNADSVAAEHANRSTRRGAKRGGRGRTKKDHEGGPSHAASNGNGAGLRIAGSASRANGGNAASTIARRELFPDHKLEGDVSSRVKGDRNGIGHTEARPHARPKLAAGGKEAFDRLTKGAISMKSTAKQEGVRSADRTARTQRESNAPNSNEQT